PPGRGPGDARRRAPGPRWAARSRSARSTSASPSSGGTRSRHGGRSSWLRGYDSVRPEELEARGDEHVELVHGDPGVLLDDERRRAGLSALAPLVLPLVVREDEGDLRAALRAHRPSSGSYSTRNGANGALASAAPVLIGMARSVHAHSDPGIRPRSRICHTSPSASRTTDPRGSASSSATVVTTRVRAATTSSITPSMIHPTVRPTSGTRTSHTLPYSRRCSARACSCN